MPIYEYQCGGCGHQLEKLQKLSDPLLTDCPECRQPKLKKLISAVGFRLKGGGWYETDFKQGSKKNLVDEGAGTAADESGSKPGKPEKKAASESSKTASDNSGPAAASSSKKGDSGTSKPV